MSRAVQCLKHVVLSILSAAAAFTAVAVSLLVCRTCSSRCLDFWPSLYEPPPLHTSPWDHHLNKKKLNYGQKRADDSEGSAHICLTQTKSRNATCSNRLSNQPSRWRSRSCSGFICSVCQVHSRVTTSDTMNGFLS